MSTFSKNLKTIPRPAWIVGGLLVLLIVLPLMLGPMRYEPEMREWPLIAKVGLLTAAPALLLAYSLLVGFIYVDAKRRCMRHVLWAWLALVPYFVGVILYFILRDPLPTRCPTCGTDVPHAFPFCPSCGKSVHPVCSECGKRLQWEWSNCPHCGVRVAPSGVASS